MIAETANFYDALVIGAGPAGSTIATLLAKSGWSVAMAEKSAFPRRKVCGEYLSPTNFRLFKKLGFQEQFLEHAGPEIRRVGLFARSFALKADMPPLDDGNDLWGRALRREILDTLLAKGAFDVGVSIFQPWSVSDVRKLKETFFSRIKSRDTNDVLEIESRVVIAAHGSWEIGSLPTQAKRQSAMGSDLLGFKAHFKNSTLSPDLMPMIVFPGGYGGMVTCDNGLMSISGCIRTDSLRELRKNRQEETLGDILQAHIFETCRGVYETLGEAERVGDWLTAGIIRPGIRSRISNGILVVGNAAGESHPIIAEGISMAIQSSGLLHRCLSKLTPGQVTDAELRSASQEYNKLWLASFRNRIVSAELYARLAMSGVSQTMLEPVVRTFPSLLTAGARLSGKTHKIAL